MSWIIIIGFHSQFFFSKSFWDWTVVFWSNQYLISQLIDLVFSLNWKLHLYVQIIQKCWCWFFYDALKNAEYCKNSITPVFSKERKICKCVNQYRSWCYLVVVKACLNQHHINMTITKICLIILIGICIIQVRKFLFISRMK